MHEKPFCYLEISKFVLCYETLIDDVEFRGVSVILVFLK